MSFPLLKEHQNDEILSIKSTRSTKTHLEWRWQTRVHLLLLIFNEPVFLGIFSSSFSSGSSCWRCLNNLNLVGKPWNDTASLWLHHKCSFFIYCINDNHPHHVPFDQEIFLQHVLFSGTFRTVLYFEGLCDPAGNRKDISRVTPRLHLLLAGWSQVRMLPLSDVLGLGRAKVLCLCALCLDNPPPTD